MKFWERIAYYQVCFIVALGLDAIWAFPVVWAWNHTMTYIFGLPEITWLMAWSLLLILNQIWRIQIVAVGDRN